MTREIARDMIRNNRPPRDNGERMICNNYLTMQSLSEWKKAALSPDLIFEIHAAITEGTLDHEDAAGRLRTADEKVEIVDERDNQILHTPPPAEQLPARLQALCDFANAGGGSADPSNSGNNKDQAPFIHPVLRAIIIHFWLAYDHPFVDGNGRTARALFYWSMLRQEFWLFEYISISEILVNAPAKYAKSYLYTETDNNDLNYFIHHQLDVIERAVKNLHNYIDHKSKEFAQTSRLLLQLDIPINHRQEALLTKALKEPHRSFTVQSHQRSHRIAYATARSDLKDLEKHGLLRSRKKAKTFHYYPAENLTERLQTLPKT